MAGLLLVDGRDVARAGRDATRGVRGGEDRRSGRHLRGTVEEPHLVSSRATKYHRSSDE